MQEPADHLEYGTVIKDGGLFRLYTRDGRGTKFGGDAPEVTRDGESRDGESRDGESRDGIQWNKLTGGQVRFINESPYEIQRGRRGSNPQPPDRQSGALTN